MVRLLLVVVLSLPAIALAQESASETALARQLFREGIEAVRAGDYEAARTAFQRSYDLSRRPVTLLNLAGAQSQTGHIVAAAESYRRYLRMTRDEGDEQRREAASTALAELEPRIPHVVISVRGIQRADRLTIDDEEISHAAIGQRLPVDPGEHTLQLERAGVSPVVEIFAINEGDDRQVSLTAPTGAPTPREVAEGDGEGDGGEGGSIGGGNGGGGGEDDTASGGLLSSPVFWIVTAAVLIGGGVAGWYFLLRDDSSGDDPFRGNLGPGQLTLN